MTFDSTGTVEVEVRAAGAAKSPLLRPLRHGVAVNQEGQTLRFTMTDATRQLCLELNGDPRHALLLFSNPPERDAPTPGDPRVTYFGPGYHKAGNIRCAGDKANGTTIYLAPGALVEGSLAISGAERVTVRGRGILYNPYPKEGESSRSPLNIDTSKNVRVEGIVLVNRADNWTLRAVASRDLAIENFHLLSEIRDGIDIINSQKATVRDSFIMTHDDAIVFKGLTEGRRQPVEDVLVERCVVANMGGGNGIEIGYESVTPVYQRLTFRDLDLLYALPNGAAPDPAWPEAAISIHPTRMTEYNDPAYMAMMPPIRDVTYQKIRIERCEDDYLFDIRPNRNSPGQGIENILIEDVSVVGGPARPSRVVGRKDHPIRNVSFRGLKILGQPITNASQGQFTIENADSVSFDQPGSTTAAEPAGTPAMALDQPFTFSYLAWENKARIEHGVVLLDAPGLTPQGGAGVVGHFNLGGHEDDCLALQVRVGPRNTLKTLKFLVRDEAGRTATWHFALPMPSNTAVLVTPLDGAALSHANETGKEGPPTLAKIIQWQMMGDWNGDGAVDVRVEAILNVKPGAQILQTRAEVAKRDEAARIQAQKERLAAREKYAQHNADSPDLQAVYAAAPDILALQIREGRITAPCKLTEYAKLPGDAMNKDKHLIRNGKDLGLLIGPPGKESGLVSFEVYSGDPLLLAEADDPANYTISSPDDPAFAPGVAPAAVERKRKADDWQQPTQGGIVVLHRVFLKLPRPLTAGKTYRVALGRVNTNKDEVTLAFNTDTLWSESVHVSQVGFRPDDPLKQAYLSLWLGSGGGYDFPARLAFHLVDAKTNRSVYTGTVGEPWPAGKTEKMAGERNFNGTAVSPIDFSDFKTPGQYRLVVDRVGCSYPFDIGAQAWEKAFWIQMKGFYNERSGVDLGPPYTDFVRPACWKPGVNDCMPITQSTYSVVDGNPNGRGTLASGDTGKPVPEAWGGYHDAGDWNPRRLDHMFTTVFWQLELLQLFPDYFGKLKLNIPNDNPGPDLLKECLFELDLFHRLQLPDGGCRYGIETDGDPAIGEVSWKQHMPAYVYAPDIFSSYLYAAIAARASQVLERHDSQLAKIYRESALKAMAWAEADRAGRIAKGVWDKIPKHKDEVVATRNLAAVCLYALTRDPHWNDLFLEDTVLKAGIPPVFRGDQYGRSAAFTYARLPEGQGDGRVKQTARQALIADADGSLAYQRNNAFGIASDDVGRPLFIGFYSHPHGAVSLVRAHYLTRDQKYLAGAVKDCLFPAGANPSNLVYTSGVGTHSVKAMNIDAIATGQKPPIGLTAYGNIDLQRWRDNWIVWPITYFVGRHTQPAAFDWPVTEAYWDVRAWPAYCEFCIDQTMGPNAYVWGYLAARN